MYGMNTVLLFLHFLGLAMGLSVGFANMVMLGIISKASPGERPVLARFPPAMSPVGRVGLALLWVTGAIMLYTKWNGLGSMPWQFHVKLTAVVILTILVAVLYRLERRAGQGDASAARRIQQLAKFSLASALVAVIFAVLTFD